jgi:hypothetical protein
MESDNSAAPEEGATPDEIDQQPVAISFFTVQQRRCSQDFSIN